MTQSELETVTPSGEHITTSYPDYRDIRDHTRLLESVRNRPREPRLLVGAGLPPHLLGRGDRRAAEADPCAGGDRDPHRRRACDARPQPHRVCDAHCHAAPDLDPSP